MKLLLAALLTLFAGTVAAAGPQLALPGEAFHGGEVPARNGETWWALVVDGKGARLQSSVLSVQAVEDPVLDEEGEATGRSVSAPGLQPLVLLRGIAALRAGPVPLALDLSEARPLTPNEPIALALGERRWSLSNRCAPVAADAGSDHPRPQRSCTIVLDDGRHLQALAPGGSAYDEPGEPPTTEASLLFAGDLDHDGKVDLLIDTSDHDNLDRPTLFLSGAGQDGQLKPVAQQEVTGC